MYCLVYHADGICPDIRDCEGCKNEIPPHTKARGMKEETRKQFEERLLLIENPIDREAIRAIGSRYLAQLDKEIEYLEARRGRNIFRRFFGL